MMGTISEALLEMSRLWEETIPAAVFSGVAPSSQTAYGYHNSANNLINSGQSNDYSLQINGDRTSDGIDRDAYCAIDMSMNRSDMILVTNRVYKSWKDANDPRLDKHREGIGTLDGNNVTYMDFQSGQLGSADDSHLWHFHKGGLRLYVNDMESVNAFISVIKGQTYAEYLSSSPPPPPSPGVDMAFLDDSNAAALAYRIDAMVSGSETARGGPVVGEQIWIVQHINAIEKKLGTSPTTDGAKLAELESKVDAILAKLASVGDALKSG